MQTWRRQAIVAASWVVFGAACSQTATDTAATVEKGAAVEPAKAKAPASLPPASQTATIPQGTRLKVRLTTAVSTESHQTGDPFTATLEEEAVSADGRVVLPKGTRVEGVVADADKGGRVQGRASVALRLTRLHPASGPEEIATNTVEREARSTQKRDAAKVGIGAGVGAAIGAIAGGGRGAAIGAGVGAGAGTATVLATRGEAAAFPAESVVTFSLRAPVVLK